MLSSKNVIPIGISDDILFGIVKRISIFLTNDAIRINDDALVKIVENVFTLPTEPERLQLLSQQILGLLQSQKLSSNLRVGNIIWLRVANCIVDNLTANIDTFKEVIYGYVEWLVKNSIIDQVSNNAIVYARHINILLIYILVIHILGNMDKLGSVFERE